MARESLLGIRFDGGYGGTLGALTLSFRLEHCSREDFSDIRLWRQPYDPTPFAFYEAQATLLATATLAGEATAFTASFPASPAWIYPCVGSRAESDYLWVTATVNPEISPDAEVWISVENASIALTGGATFTVANGAAQAPHRVFPYIWQIGAYLRQDSGLTATWAGRLENRPAERLGHLTDVILVNDMKVRYDSAADCFTTTWDGRGRDNSGQAARVRTLRDAHHPACRVRACLTKGDNVIAVDGVKGYPIACAAASAARRAQLVASICRTLDACGLDGLDIDWEYPGDHVDGAAQVERDWMAYGLLMRDLAAAFFDRGWTLSFCTNLGYKMAPESCHGAFHAADYINAMAYGGSPLNASPQVMMTGLAVATSRGVPKRRIVAGQAMYAAEGGNPAWGTVIGFLDAAYPGDLARQWDADLVWTNRVHNGTTITKETFEGPASHHAKAVWCRANGYGGVMSWGYYADAVWGNERRLCLARHQAAAIWPEPRWSPPDPPQDADGFYLLDSEEDWRWLGAHGDVSARLAGDIALTHDPLPIDRFSGTLDGAGHTLRLAEDAWIAGIGQTALVRNLTGTVKNLRIDLHGRIVNRASRWYDTTADLTANTLAGTNHTAALAGTVNGGGLIENVELIVREGAEIQGPGYVGGLAALVFAAAGDCAAVRDCRVQVAGTLRSLARNTAEALINPDYATVGTVAGWVACPAGGSVEVSGNVAVLEPTAVLAAETGATASVGGLIGDLNNANPALADNAVYVAAGASLANNNAAQSGKVKLSHGVASFFLGAGASVEPCAVAREPGAAVLASGVGGVVAAEPASLVLTASPQEAGTALQVAAFSPAPGGEVRLAVRNAGNDAVAIGAGARPVVEFLDGAGGVAERVRPERTAVEGGVMSFALPTPSAPRDPQLFRVRLTP